MSTQQDKIFANGFIFKRRDNAPNFVIGQISIKASDAIAFIQEHENEQGWLNLKVNQAQNGRYYMELDTFVPQQGGGQAPPAQAPAKAPAPKAQPQTIHLEPEASDDLPF